MQSLRYERFVVAYHGCDEDVRNQVLLGRADLKASENDHDWLGHGIYFWEYGPERARQWAEEQACRGRIKTPAVLGALIHLGDCFDLLDVRYTEVLETAWPAYGVSQTAIGLALPENRPAGSADPDFLIRRRDCAVINWTLERYETETGRRIHTVRGVFQEGQAAFPGGQIMKKSHIQIAVRDSSCVRGYFLPR